MIETRNDEKSARTIREIVKRSVKFRYNPKTANQQSEYEFFSDFGNDQTKKTHSNRTQIIIPNHNQDSERILNNRSITYPKISEPVNPGSRREIHEVQ
jgi:hypothetical protein